MIYFCCEEGRRNLVQNHPSFNGIDYLEVVHSEEPLLAEQQRTLRVYFVKPPQLELQTRFGPDKLANAAMVRVTGGERASRINVDWVELVGDRVDVHVTPRGDYSVYTLQLVEPNSETPLQQLDPALASVDFYFKVECESEFDCRSSRRCPPGMMSAPDLDYLAKDYTSFRQLMLDRIALLSPAWSERSPADLSVALVELFAYVGDYLSYRQDAISTEAYLGTARRRVSLRRHARLLDYALHDGCNARAWVQVRLKPEATRGARLMAEGCRLRFVTRLSPDAVLSEHEFQRLVATGRGVVFEPTESVDLFPEHNQLYFHTWGSVACCLPKGAMKATLRGSFPNLRPGQVLVFVERIGPKSGHPDDASPLQRHAVRLSRVNGLDDWQYREAKLNNALPLRTDPLFEPPVEITEIEWTATDALPFPLCLSSRAEGGWAALGRCESGSR